MNKKIVSAMLAGVLTLSSAAIFSGCGGDGEFPVEIANVKIEKEPKNIVVLDPNAADIIANIGYEGKMVGRSDEVTQEDLALAESVGSAASPDVDKIKSAEANIVFADSSLDSEIKKELEDSKIQVLEFAVADTAKQLKTTYSSIGKALGGAESGLNKADNAYTKLFDDMEKIKEANTSRSGSSPTVCYIFKDDTGLNCMSKNTFGDLLLSYTGGVNVGLNINQNLKDNNRAFKKQLQVANPNYIFYSDEATLNEIKSSTELAGLTAVKTNKTMMVPLENLNRQGQTALDTLNSMVSFINPESNVNTKTQRATQATTQPATSSATASTAPTSATEASTEPTKAAGNTSGLTPESIKKSGLSLKNGQGYEEKQDDKTKDELRNNIIALQNRLISLGYVEDSDEYRTGYFGNTTQMGVEDFQEKNGIDVTGEADNATLIALFSPNAKKAD